jgi:hypothetical protein
MYEKMAAMKNVVVSRNDGLLGPGSGAYLESALSKL